MLQTGMLKDSVGRWSHKALLFGCDKGFRKQNRSRKGLRVGNPSVQRTGWTANLCCKQSETDSTRLLSQTEIFATDMELKCLINLAEIRFTKLDRKHDSQPRPVLIADRRVSMGTEVCKRPRKFANLSLEIQTLYRRTKIMFNDGRRQDRRMSISVTAVWFNMIVLMEVLLWCWEAFVFKGPPSCTSSGIR